MVPAFGKLRPGLGEGNGQRIVIQQHLTGAQRSSRPAGELESRGSVRYRAHTLPQKVGFGGREGCTNRVLWLLLGDEEYSTFSIRESHYSLHSKNLSPIPGKAGPTTAREASRLCPVSFLHQQEAAEKQN